MVSTTLWSPKLVRAEQLEAINKSGEIKIGMEGTLPPFSFHDQYGALAGFEVELGREIARRLGVQANFQEARWDALLMGLDSGRFDVVIDDVFVTEERKKSFLFSVPYMASRSVIVTRKSATALRTLEALKGKSTAQSEGTVQADTARKHGASVVYANDIGTMALLVTQGRVDCMLLSSMEFAGLMKDHPDLDLKADAILDLTQYSAVVLPKSAFGLQKAVDTAMTAIRAEGQLSKLSVKYFGADLTE